MTESTATNKKRGSFRIRVEPRLNEPPAWYPAAVSFGALIVALILGGILISCAGGDPIKSYLHIAKASFGDIGVLSDTIVKATPIILVALACSVAFRMKLWNIGAEGQFIMGAFGAKCDRAYSATDVRRGGALFRLPGDWPGGHRTGAPGRRPRTKRGASSR